MNNHIHQKINTAIFSAFVYYISVTLVFAQSAALLPNALQVYLDANGNPLSGGTVGFYFPSTLNLKPIWQNANESIVYTNPVTLNAAGQPPSATGIYGQGAYRQIVKDINGNTIWDALTSSTGAGGGSAATGDGDLVGTVKPWAGIIAPNQYQFTYGQQLSRTTFALLFTAITQLTNVTCTSSSNTLSGIADTTQIPISAPVEVSCVSPGTTVVSKTASTVVMSNPSSVSLNTTATFFPFGNGDGSTTFTLPDFRGNVIAGRPNMGGTASTNLTNCTNAAQGTVCGNQNKTLVIANLPNVSVNANTAYAPGNVALNSGPNANQPFIQSGALSTAQSGAGAVAVNASNNLTSATSLTVPIPSYTPSINLNGGVTQTPFSAIQPTVTLNYIIKVTPDSNSAIATGVTDIQGMVGSIACGTGISCTGNIISLGLGVNPVSGPLSSIANHITIFSNTSGNVLADSGINFNGVDGNNYISVTSSRSVAPTDCNGTLQLGTGSTGFLTLTFPSVSGFPTVCSLKAIDGDTTRGKAIAGLTGITKLYPAQTFGAKIVNGAWALFDKPPRYLVASSSTLFFNKDQGNDTNDCLAAGTGACATSAQVMFDLTNNIDDEGTVTFQMGCTTTPCTYTDLPFQSTGYIGAGSVIIQGDITTNSNYVWTCAVSCAGGAIINFNPGTNGVWTVQGFTLNSSLATVAGIQIAYPAAARILFQKNTFGAFATGEAFNCIGAATINDITGGNYSITGGGLSFANIQDGCIAHFDKAVGTISGTPAFATAFLIAHGAGAIIGTDNTHFSGSATGVRCNANLLGLIDAAGTSASLPGNSVCTTATGGIVN